MRNENKIQRGQVWYITYNNNFGSEMAVGRPVVVVSSNEGNETSPLVTVAYMTTTPKYSDVAVEVYSTNKRSWVLCQQIVTLDKKKLDSYMCTLSEPEMLKIDLGLKKALDLTTNDNGLLEQFEDLEKQVSTYSDLLGETKQKNSELEVELVVYKRLYEKALDKIVEIQFSNDTGLPTGEVVYIPNRNYKHGLRKGSKPEEFLPYKTGDTANVNTMAWYEIVANTGMANQLAMAITGYRSMHGKYKELNDLLKVPRFGVRCMDKYGRMLEV